MIRKPFHTLTTLLLLIVFTSTVNGQIENGEIEDKVEPMTEETLKVKMEFSGVVLDTANNTPLAYASIYIVNTSRGTISNELGLFSINTSGLSKTDTLRFQYAGYKTKSISLAELESHSEVYMAEEFFSLNEVLVFNSETDAEAIVKNVIKNKKLNYQTTTSKKKMFIRGRDNLDLDDIHFDCKKNSIAELDKERIENFGDSLPKNALSHTDFLGEFYFNEVESKAFKVDPIKMVALPEEFLSLKEGNTSEPEKVIKILEDAFNNTKENEYWKLKTGIFSTKIENESSDDNKSNSLDDERFSNYTLSIEEKLRFSQMEDKNLWEFLYRTSNYEYTLAGGTHVNGEDVYIIDFTPKESGLYMGRLFITMNTYALIKADYTYAPDKIGESIKLLGIGYKEKHFKGSVYFVKNEDNYRLKYFSRKLNFHFSIDRNFALRKKRKRFLIDKKLEEIKVGLILKFDIEDALEVMVIDDKEISNQQFEEFNQPEYFKSIIVDQFDDALWKDYDIIEPTAQMKNYKKQTYP